MDETNETYPLQPEVFPAGAGYEPIFEFHFQTILLDAGEEKYYAAGLVQTATGKTVDLVATLMHSFCETEPNNGIYNNWVVRYLGNVLMDMAATQKNLDRSSLLLVRATHADGRDCVFVGKKADG